MENQNKTQAPADNSTLPPKSRGRSEAETIDSLDAELRQRRREQGIQEDGGQRKKQLTIDRLKATWNRPETPEEAERRERRLRQEADHDRRREAVGRKKRWTAFIERRGSRYKDCTFGNYKIDHEAQKPVVASVKQYASEMADRVEAGQSILFYGPCGSGKDHLAIALARIAILDHRLRVLWKDGQQLFASLRDAIHFGRSEASIVDPLIKADVLILSDPMPTGGALTNFQSSTLYGIVDARYSRSRPTWVTINAVNQTAAAEKIGVAVVDRLTDGALTLACNWPSYRKPIGPSPRA